MMTSSWITTVVITATNAIDLMNGRTGMALFLQDAETERKECGVGGVGDVNIDPLDLYFRSISS